jgi:hypothetical protein
MVANFKPSLLSSPMIIRPTAACYYGFSALLQFGRHEVLAKTFAARTAPL